MGGLSRSLVGMLLGARYVSAFQSSGLSRAVATKRGMRMPGALARAFPPSVGSSLARMATTSSDVQAPCRPPSVIGEDGQLATQYDFAAVEEGTYAWWESEGFFKPSPPSSPGKKAYTLPMPPPNVTGRLHMGHAMFVALQDILARFHRMRGRPTLWLPGTDHAGIATQMLVEREVVAEGGTREGMGRDAFLERAWAYKADKGGQIVDQIRRLGASADWTREKFTLDPKMNEAVVEAFVKFHEDGLLYRGTRLVNWSPQLQTAVSDLEVEFSEEVGKLYYFKYQVDGSSSGEYLPVATTRPETILGDTAVCVHPEDPRYAHLIGQNVVLPVEDGVEGLPRNSDGKRTIPIIADEYVDMEFGTGALKITPAHDANDYELGKKFGLEMPSIFAKDGTVNDKGGAKYAGLDRFVARDAIWADLEASGIALKVEPHTQRVPRSQRGGEVIEPMLSTQWFLQMQSMADAALEAVHSGEIAIKPKRFEKEWDYWMGNPRDWCVSRQLWWGHRIPVWYREGADRENPGVEYFVGRSEDEARSRAGDKLQPNEVLLQDNDVLDTWFSSGLWPMATMGWPQVDPQEGDPLQAQTHDEWNALSDYAKFYPATCLETGYDILFFWVARMVMMGIHFTGKAPFEVIYMHGLVRDAQGAKMSKTKGNVVDPLETLEKFGTDALRYSLVTGVTPGQDVPLSMEKVEANRNFANKLWNAGRYLLGNLADLDPKDRQALAVSGPMPQAEFEALGVPERFIVSKCHELVEKVTNDIEAYDMSDAGFAIYQFLWDEYADWYIEASKTRLSGPSADPEEAAQARRVLVYVFDTCLRLLHPFMPYVTETLWQQLPTDPTHGTSLMVAPWPLMEEHGEALSKDPIAVAQFTDLQGLVRAVRNARAEYQVDPGKKCAAEVLATNPAMREFLMKESATIALLGRVDSSALTFPDPTAAANNDDKDKDGSEGGTKAKKAVHLVIADGLEADLPMDQLVDAAKERKRLTKQLAALEKDVGGLEKRLSSSGFLSKASAEVVAETQALLAKNTEAIVGVKRSLADLD